MLCQLTLAEGLLRVVTPRTSCVDVDYMVGGNGFQKMCDRPAGYSPASGHKADKSLCVIKVPAVT